MCEARPQDRRVRGFRLHDMKYWAVTHRHTTFVAAETEAGAKEDCARQVRDNAGADECTAVEISEGEYGRHWEMQETAPWPGAGRLTEG
jgi:hypothetical protein